MSTKISNSLALETITAEDCSDPKPVLMLAQFDTADLLMSAAEKVRDQ